MNPEPRFFLRHLLYACAALWILWGMVKTYLVGALPSAAMNLAPLPLSFRLMGIVVPLAVAALALIKLGWHWRYWRIDRSYAVIFFTLFLFLFALAEVLSLSFGATDVVVLDDGDRDVPSQVFADHRYSRERGDLAIADASHVVRHCSDAPGDIRQVGRLSVKVTALDKGDFVEVRVVRDPGKPLLLAAGIVLIVALFLWLGGALRREKKYLSGRRRIHVK